MQNLLIGLIIGIVFAIFGMSIIVSQDRHVHGEWVQIDYTWDDALACLTPNRPDGQIMTINSGLVINPFLPVEVRCYPDGGIY